MTRIIIEVDGKEVSSTTVQPTGSLAAPPELLARPTALGALDAGSAPSVVMNAAADFASAASIDAGPSREKPAASSEHAEDSKRKNKQK